MMRIFLLFFVLFCSTTLAAQSTAELEKQLKTAKTKRAQMDLKYQLASKYMRSNSKKAKRYAFESFDLARSLKDKDMMAKTAYLDAEIHLKKREKSKASARFKTSLNHAKSIGNNELALSCLEKLQTIAKQDRNYRTAYQHSQAAVALLSRSGGKASSSSSQKPASSSNSGGASSAELKKLRDDNIRLARDKKILKREIEDMNKTLDALQLDSEKYEEVKEEFAQAKEKAEKEINAREEELANISEEKDKIEASKKRRDRQIAKLSKEDLQKELKLQEAQKDLMQASLETEKSQNLSKILGLAGAFALALILFIFSRLRSNRRAKKALEEKTKLIEEERQRSDELLRNILPEAIAEELKENGKAKAQKYDDATVLFTDFKNFTRVAEKLTPEQLVQELDNCFRAFDFIISQYKIEKIKTIGDAYMCASGLSERNTMPNDIIKAGLEMQEYLNDIKKEKIAQGLPYFEARIGVHTGPVVAGVVGINKFAYDIWGDTVNIAARMEANCEEGKVNISESTFSKIQYRFNCNPRGKIAAKNKGMIEMYYVNGEVNN
ncbi:MAG: adenylate/guanylate cyclase domain-containing protein [Saprospiraceae bacterium]